MGIILLRNSYNHVRFEFVSFLSIEPPNDGVMYIIFFLVENNYLESREILQSMYRMIV